MKNLSYLVILRIHYRSDRSQQFGRNEVLGFPSNYLSHQNPKNFCQKARVFKPEKTVHFFKYSNPLLSFHLLIFQSSSDKCS